MILVSGATGNVGAALVRALVRQPDAALPNGVERAIGDLNERGPVRGTDRQAVAVEGTHDAENVPVTPPDGSAEPN